MIQRNDLYDYGKYIYQNDDYFKFSLDSILLAEFVKFKKGQRVLDICCGNAPVPLILATKEKTLTIEAVEIQKSIYDLAKRSIDESGFSNITIYNCDAKEYIAKEKYDIVTCNPPYFKVTKDSMLNDNVVKRNARHETLIELNDIVRVAKTNLKENGKLYIVHRVERLIDTINLMDQYKFGIRRICFVYTTNKNAEFFLIEGELNKKNDPKVRSICIEKYKTYKNIFEE